MNDIVRYFFLVFGCVFLSIEGVNCQELNWVSEYSGDYDALGGMSVSTILLKPNNNPIVLARTFNTDGGRYTIGNTTTELPAGASYLMELDQNGEVLWKRGISFERMSNDSFSGRIIMKVDESFNFYLSFLSRGDLNVSVDGDVREIRDDPALGFIRITTLKFGSDGVFKEQYGFNTDREIYNLFDVELRDDEIYYLYALRDIEHGAGCNDNELTEFIDVRDANSGVLINQKTFYARTENTCDGISGGGLLFYRMTVDKIGSVYLTGYLNGDYTTTLSDQIKLDDNKGGSPIVKLDQNLNFEWFRAIKAQLTTMGNAILDDAGDLYFVTNTYDGNGVPEIVGAENPYANRELVTSMSSILKMNSDGEVIWLNTFDTGFFFSPNDNNDFFYFDNGGDIWFPFFRKSFKEGYNHFDSENVKTFIQNKNVEGKGDHYGYLRLSKEGKVNSYNFFKGISNGQYDYMDHNLFILPLDNDCNDFFMSATYLGEYDISFTDEPRVINNGDLSGDIFLAKYGNVPPKMVKESLPSETCSSQNILIPLEFIDESLLDLHVNITSDQQDVVSDDRIFIEKTNGTYIMLLTELLGAGEVSFLVEMIDECGAVTVDSFKVNFLNGLRGVKPVIVEAGLDLEICEGDTQVLTTTSDEGFIWSTGETTSSITVGAGEYWITSLANGTCESVSSDTVSVVEVALPQKPVISVSGNLTFCEGGSVELIASSDNSVLWSNGATTKSIVVNESGTFSVQETSNICGVGPASDEVTIEVNPIPTPPVITVLGNSNFCEGESVVLKSSYSSGNVWSNGATSQEIIINKSGVYSVVNVANNCMSENSEPITIMVDEDFSLSLNQAAEVCPAFSEIFELTPDVSLNNLNFEWSDGSNLETLFVDRAGDFWLKVTNGTCQQEAFISVEEVCFPVLYVPSAFSPNGDGNNDLFKAITSRVSEIQISVYNRWGSLVFHTALLDAAWDGSINGQKAPKGNYAYVITYKGIVNDNESVFTKRGKLTLVR